MNSLRERIEKKCQPVPECGCWLWTGAVFNHGRPQLRMGEKLVLASRASVLAFKGVDPGDGMVCHKCDTPSCVNPDHLYVGSHSQNMLDRNLRGRQARVRGEANGRSHLSETQVMQIKAIHATGMPTEAIGMQFGVSGRQIRYIVNGVAWPHMHGAVGAAA